MFNVFRNEEFMDFSNHVDPGVVLGALSGLDKQGQAS